MGSASLIFRRAEPGFYRQIAEAADATLPKEFTETPVVFQSDGSYLDSEDFKGDPDGQEFRNIAGEAGRPDLQRRVDIVHETIGSRLDRIDQTYAEENDCAVIHRIQEEAPAIAPAAGAAPLAVKKGTRFPTTGRPVLGPRE